MLDQQSNFKYIVFVIASIIFYLVVRGRGFIQFDYGLFFPLLIAVLHTSSQAIFWWSRYNMPKVTVNNFSGSILGRPVLLRDKNDIVWAIFNTGEYLEPWHGLGKLATLVVPWSQLHQAGKNYVGLTFVKLCPLRFLPPVVNNFLRYSKEDYNLDKIYYGYFDEDFIHKNPDFKDIEEKIENLQSRINFQRKVIEGNNDEIVEQIELGKKLAGNQRRWWQVLPRSSTQEVD